jgi:hypothetical protein
MSDIISCGNESLFVFCCKVDKQPLSPSVTKQPKTPLAVKSPVFKKDADLDLPKLDTEAPKLQHLGADRPRRPKNKAITRPTVGLEPSKETPADTTDAAVDTGVNEFFSASLDAGSGGAALLSPRVVNGESENIGYVSWCQNILCALLAVRVLYWIMFFI